MGHEQTSIIFEQIDNQQPYHSMDIAIINRPLGMRRGGGEIWDIEISNKLYDMGHDVTLYTGKPLSKDITKPIDLPTVKIKSPFLYDLGYAAPIGIGGVIADIDRQLFISQLKRRFDQTHDIIVAGHPEILRIKDSVDCPMSIKLNGPPHSLFYDYIHPTKSSYSWLKHADEVITGGITTKIIQEKTAIEPTVINPGVDITRFSPDGSKVDTSEPTILWVGRFVPAKNLTELLNAFQSLRDNGIKAELVLVGEGPLESELKTKVSSSNIGDSVRFEGYVPNKELPPYYRTADVFALCSKHESFGMVLLEAMASGTPVVAPRIDYIPEIVSDEQAGLLYQAGDPDDLYNKMRQLLLNPDQGRELGQYARETVTSKFTWEQQAKKLIDSCNKCMD